MGEDGHLGTVVGVQGGEYLGNLCLDGGARDVEPLGDPRRLGVLEEVAAAGGVAVGLAVWIAAVALLGVNLTARSGEDLLVVGPGAVFVAGLVASLAALGLLALLERTTRRPRRTWTIVAVSVLVVSLAGPLMQGTSAAAAATLLAMHVAVGTAIIVAVGGTARPGRRDG